MYQFFSTTTIILLANSLAYLLTYCTSQILIVWNKNWTVNGAIEKYQYPVSQKCYTEPPGLYGWFGTWHVIFVTAVILSDLLTWPLTCAKVGVLGGIGPSMAPLNQFVSSAWVQVQQVISKYANWSLWLIFICELWNDFLCSCSYADQIITHSEPSQKPYCLDALDHQWHHWFIQFPPHHWSNK